MGISAIAALLKEEPPDEAMPSREVVIRYEIIPGMALSVSREMETREARKVREIIRMAKAIAQGKATNE